MDTSSPLPAWSSMKRLLSSHRAFSLVEVAMSIGIVAFAFVAILGLLPTGMTTFRASIDRTNEGRIMQVFSSRAQATKFSEVQKQLDFELSGEMFFFDEEGFLVGQGVSLDSMQGDEKQKVLYAVKVFFEPGWAMNDSQASDRQALRGNVEAKHSRTAYIVMASIYSSGFKQLRDSLSTLSDLQQALRSKEKNRLKSDVRMRTLLIPQMDGAGGTTTTSA